VKHSYKSSATSAPWQSATLTSPSARSFTPINLSHRLLNNNGSLQRERDLHPPLFGRADPSHSRSCGRSVPITELLDGH
jgi:hypothetical protein